MSFTPQMADENYYWVWAQNLSLSYYDHPPMVAWLFRLGELLPDSLLKGPAVVLGHLALLIWAQLLKNLGFNKYQIQTWFLLSVMAPLVGMSAMVLTPDLPLLFFFSLSIYFFERALREQKTSQYGLFGLALGLGFTAKYHIALVVPSLVLFLTMTGQWRRVRWNLMPMVVIIALLGAAPVILWNYQNDWASFKFQFHHGMGKKTWKAIWPLEYLLSVLFLVLPFYWKTLWLAVKSGRQKLLIYSSVPILLLFMLSSFRSKVEANWTQLAFLPALSLLAYVDQSRWKARLALGLWSFMLVGLLFAWSRPWFPNCPEKLCEPRRYQGLLSEIDQHQPLLASNYQMASYLWFQTKRPVFKLYDMSRRDYFDTFSEARPKGNSFFLAKHLETELPSWLGELGYRNEVVKNIDPDLVILRVYR